MNPRDNSINLVNLLDLNSPPLGIKFVQSVEMAAFTGFSEKKLRFCQALMLARKGEEVRLTADNITCPAAASAFGFRALPDKIINGEMMHFLGLFGNPEAAAKTISLMPRLTQGSFSAVLVAPLEKCDWIPEVIVIEAEPEKLMWIALADIFNSGGRHYNETGVFQAACIDAVVVPFIRQKMNYSLGCYGCRDATDLSSSETVLGFPAAWLERIMGALEKLSLKAMPRSRSKIALQQVLSK